MTLVFSGMVPACCVQAGKPGGCGMPGERGMGAWVVR